MAYKAIIWDLDGTLVESLPGIVASTNNALKDHGFPQHPPEAIRSFIGDGSWMLCRRAIKNTPDRTIDQVYKTFAHHYKEDWKTGTTVYDGIIDLLNRCRDQHVKFAVLSNKPHAFTIEIVARLFADFSFDLVMGQQEGIPQKPSPEGTLLCLEKLGTSKEETLFIGDSTVDLKTAKNAKVPCAAVTWGYHDTEVLKAEGADHFADTVTKLENIITH